MWKCAQDGGFEPDLASIDQWRRILLMVTKDAAMSFSQFGYPYNATSQVSKMECHLLFFSKDFTMAYLPIRFNSPFEYNISAFMACTSISCFLQHVQYV